MVTPDLDCLATEDVTGDWCTHAVLKLFEPFVRPLLRVRVWVVVQRLERLKDGRGRLVLLGCGHAAGCKV